jgi:hypothetical protein
MTMRELHLQDRYTSRQTGPLTREERDVAEALVGHCTAVGGTERDWIPLADEYAAYVRWWLREHGHWRTGPAYSERYPILTPRQFGAALRRVFPAIKPMKRILLRGQPRVWGYVGLRHP